MRDVTEQMTAYFDATVERVTAEDILAGAEVRSQDGQLAPTRVPRLRPAWVVVAGFAATIVLVGGVVGLVQMLGGDSTIEVGTGVSPSGDGSDGLSGVSGLLITAGVLLVLAAAGLVLRNRKLVKERDMQTLEKPETEVSPRPRSPAILILIVALLVLAAGALGWWIGSSGDGGSADTPEVVSLFNQALVDGDGDAMAALHTDNGIWEERDLEMPAPMRDEQYIGTASIAAHLNEGAAAANTEQITVDNIMVLDNVIVYEWTASGTSNSLPFETTGVLVFEMHGDLIARSYLFYDSDEWFNLR
ncbi:MAG: nuclear transport factor 2 family protein [Acidimicrobiia bacterium]|nr:nuclear transport factor 2 family protein [Acidimicrobiia bacterium]